MVGLITSAMIEAALAGRPVHSVLTTLAGAALLGELRRRPDFAAPSRSFDLVKMPHHGSANVDASFLEAVRAPVAVVSVGADNDYGHPAKSLLALLRRLGCATYRTDRDGDIALVSAGGSVSVMRRGP